MMTDYETKNLHLLDEINRRLAVLMDAQGLTLPEKPPRKPVEIKRSNIGTTRPIGPGSWMGR